MTCSKIFQARKKSIIKKEKKLELEKLNIKTKCDFTGCKNLANVAFFESNDNKKKMCFCENCINSIYSCYAKTIIPKGIETPYKRKGKKI